MHVFSAGCARWPLHLGLGCRYLSVISTGITKYRNGDSNPQPQHKTIILESSSLKMLLGAGPQNSSHRSRHFEDSRRKFCWLSVDSSWHLHPHPHPPRKAAQGTLEDYDPQFEKHWPSIFPHPWHWAHTLHFKSHQSLFFVSLANVYNSLYFILHWYSEGCLLLLFSWSSHH